MTISPPEAPPASKVDGARPPGRRRRWLLGGMAAAVVVAVGALTVLAARYQPLIFGGSEGGDFPGAPAALGMRTVNAFGGQDGQTYIPPQGNRAFTVLESIRNNGPWAVTLDQVSLVQPSELSWGKNAWPLLNAGPTPWWYQESPPSGTGRSIAGFTLQPGKAISVGITVRQARPCYERNGWTRLDAFWVKEHFGLFSHWVQLPLGRSLIMHGPESATTNGAICSSGASG